ncbi:MAG TPA: carboxylesterase family protein, partial [Terriglobales bacterium]
AAAAGESGTGWVQPSVSIIASPKKNIVETENGKIFGYSRRGTITFKGIPYGATTTGRARFQPPSNPKPWTGVRSSLYWGHVSPQDYTDTFDAQRAGWNHDDEAFMCRWEDGHSSEDCLHLNVWTPSINDNAKRPVMVWIHGGGYTAGSDQEMRMYPGGSLSRRGDVVVVSVNHRLGVLGYGNFMEYGTQYSSSPNIGQLDLVAALQWIKNNISNFGGDPNRVLIFGQSGGGAKVSVLMGMPLAKGLFHRAVVESGSSLRQGTPEASARVAAGVVAALGLSKATFERIHELPVQQLIQATVTAQRIAAAAGAGGGPGIGGFGPVVDGNILPRNSFDPDASPYSAQVPLIVGTVYNEFYNTVQMGDISLEDMTLAEARQRLSSRGRGGLGQDASRVIQAFQAAHPTATPFEVFSVIAATSSMRRNALTQAARKAAQGGAPAYNYWFQWQTPILDGRPRAFHTSELPFVFYNTERCAYMTGGGPDALKLGGVMADAWISFARTGDPNHAGLPNWPKYDAATVPTMIFDNDVRAVNDPDGEVRKAIDEAMKS